MKRMTLGIALAAVVLLTTLLPQAATAITAPTYDQQAIHATNVQRTSRGLLALKRNACVQRYAAMQARRMARQHRMFHQDLHAPLRNCHLTWVGENVAEGFRTGRAVVKRGWMRSPEHRANILFKRFRLIGLAARKSGGVWYVSQVFGRR